MGKARETLAEKAARVLNGRCDHTLVALDADGNAMGSWEICRAKRSERLGVRCKVCGRFYGWIRAVEKPR